MGKKKKKIDLSTDDTSFGHNPFAAALAATTAPEAPAEVLDALADTPPQAWDLSTSKNLVIRCDTKRRRGRVVTLIEGIEGASKADLKELARTLGKRLGTGATVDTPTTLLIQGDHRERLPDLLATQGAQSVKVHDF